VTGSRLLVQVDRDRCMGSGSCAFHAPETFDLDDTAKVLLLDTRDPDDRIRAAVESCPTKAIILTEEG